MSPDSAIEAEEWLAKARDLAPTVERYRDACERERRLVEPLFEAIRDAGFFQMLVPRAFGGYQTDLETNLRVVEELSRQDGAVGWNVMIGSGGGLFADYLPEAVAQELLGQGQVCAGSLTPGGTATVIEGGYRVSGRWPFASGCQNADWVAGACRVIEDGQPKLREDGAPLILVLCFKPAQYEILDTWSTGGLRGTGSHDFQVGDAFVAEEYGFPFLQLVQGPPARPGLVYPIGFVGVAGAMVASVGLGIARDAIDSFEMLAKTKSRMRGPAGRPGPIEELETVQERVGRAEMLLRAARSFHYDTARVSIAAAYAGTYDDERRALNRLAAAYAAETAAAAVDLVYKLGGGSAVYTSSRLDRCFRDVNTVTQHSTVQQSNVALGGRYFLGLGLGVGQPQQPVATP